MDKFMPDCSDFFSLKITLHRDILKIFLNISTFKYVLNNCFGLFLIKNENNCHMI